MTPMKVVVLLSGGLDSNLALAELVNKSFGEVERVHALIFSYEQSSSKEVERAKSLCEWWHVPCTVKTLSLAQRDTHHEIPARNLIFISHAAAFAKELGFNTVAIGAEPDSTYTDSSVKFLKQADELLKLFDLQLIAPVKHLANKLALVKRALDLGVPLHYCHSSRSQEVDGNCKTSSLFLTSLEQALEKPAMSGVQIIQELNKMEYLEEPDCFYIRYNQRNSFKYPAALFSVLARPEFRMPHATRVKIFSTGSWMQDMKDVLALPALKSQVFAEVVFEKTTRLDLLMSQMVNCDSNKWARWGVKQAMSLLPRPRYQRYIACRQTQGHLAATLKDMGYVVESPAYRSGILLETDPVSMGTFGTVAV